MFHPGRLAVARKLRGLSKVALAEKSGLSLRSITGYEAGEIPPSDAALATLAKTLSIPVGFFDGPDLDEPNADGASFRSLTGMTGAERNAALAAGTLAIAVAKWIDERFCLPTPDVPSMRGFDPEAAAETLRTEWGVGQRPIRNMVHLLESRGVRVFSLPAHSANVDAFSLWHRDVPYVFLNTAKSGEHGRFDAAHELGHLALHRHGGSARNRHAEMEAHRFASAFLMPAGTLLGSAPRVPTIDKLMRLKHRWSVSLIALTHRLHALKVLSEWQYRMLCIDIAKRGYRKSEPQGIHRETSQVLGKVFKALRDEHIHRSAIARDLQIETSDLESLVFGLVVFLAADRRGGDVSDDKQKPRSNAQLRLFYGGK
jgi:Zn-dependent peptidase ImmA (M78 family)/transcriptional regulator with XRE-family HTH domain